MSRPSPETFRRGYAAFCYARQMRRAQLESDTDCLGTLLRVTCKTSLRNIAAAIDDSNSDDTKAWSMLMSVLGFHSPDAMRATDPSARPPSIDPHNEHLLELLRSRAQIQLPPWPDNHSNPN